MAFPRGAAFGRAAAVVAGVALIASCGGGSSPPPGPQVGVPPDATTVTGSERLRWSQPDNARWLEFLAYVDVSAVKLDAVTCNEAQPEAECSSPLPPMSDGVHTIALVARSSISGAESERSDSITVRKVSARSVISAASFPDADTWSSIGRLEAMVTTPHGRAFAVDVVARALKTPVQLAATPDGRLLVADATGGVRLLRPGEPEPAEVALDARALLDPPPIGAVGVAPHPDFERNHFVYVSFLAKEAPERTRLRVVRMREVGDTMGEPATIFETPVMDAKAPVTEGGQSAVAHGLPGDGPRLAFGPDGLLYALLPVGLGFGNEPAASRPLASMLRLGDDGRVSEVGPLADIIAHPLGFAWHPSADALLVILPGESGEASIRAVTGGSTAAIPDMGRARLRLSAGGQLSSGALLLQSAEADTFALARVFAGALDQGRPLTVRLAIPILADGILDGVSGRIVDVVAAGGAVYLAMDDAGAPGRAGSEQSGVVIRLRPR